MSKASMSGSYLGSGSASMSGSYLGSGAASMSGPAPAGAAPSGEVVNYQTARQTLLEMITATQVQVDAAAGALTHLTDVKAHVEALELATAGLSQAAQTKLDHMSALHVDAGTLGHVGTQVEALPADSVNNLYEAVEVLEKAIADRAEKAALALDAEKAELEHLDATYGEAAATVEEQLSGDERFVGSTGAGTAAAN